jgi:hypothetical protein
MQTKVIQALFVGGKVPSSHAIRHGAAIQARVLPPAMSDVTSVAINPTQLGLSTGGGRPLPQQVLAKMEAALGADFSGVRVHVGTQAARIGALAFTTGNDIYFSPGRYQPETRQGQQLLGHELAHVIQQRQGRVRSPGGGLAIVQDHKLEAEADRLGMRAAQFVMSPAQGGRVQRKIAKPIPGRTAVQPMFDATGGAINTLTELNNELRHLTPEVSGVSIDQFEVPGVHWSLMNAAIAANNTHLFNGMRRRDVLSAANLRTDLRNRVNITAPTYSYDPHGNKHFPGGPPGTKFNGTRLVVNPQIEGLITAEIGRIRRHARGRNTNYYFTIADNIHGIAECLDDLTIQITYKAAADEIEYHGYPDNNVLAYSLATAKNGVNIPA